MNTNRLKSLISGESINEYLLERSFKEFIILNLTDDQLEQYAKKYGDWLERQYNELLMRNQSDQNEFVLKNLILFNYIHQSQRSGD